METAAQGILTRDEMESRRLLAAQDLQNGLTQSQIANKFGVSRTTASRWNRALHGNGVDSLRKRRATGRPSRLNREQQQGIAELFAHGARAAGFADGRWTTARLAAVIRMRYGIRYDPDHVGRLMHQLGLRPRRVAAQRTAPEAIYASPPAISAFAEAAQPAA